MQEGKKMTFNDDTYSSVAANNSHHITKQKLLKIREIYEFCKMPSKICKSGILSMPNLLKSSRRPKSRLNSLPKGSSTLIMTHWI